MGDIPYDQMARHIGLNSAKVFFPPGRMYGEGREPKFDILRVRELKDAIRFLKLFSPTRFGGLSLGGRKADLVKRLTTACTSRIDPSGSYFDLPHPPLPSQPPLEMERLYVMSLSSDKRSPFFKVLKKVAIEQLDLYKTKFIRTHLPPELLPTDYLDPTRHLHLTMIDEKGRVIPFNRSYRLEIQGLHFEPPQPIVVKGQRKKGLLIHDSIDVTRYAKGSYFTLMITPPLQYPMKPDLRCLLALEIVQDVSPEEILEMTVKKLQMENVATSTEQKEKKSGFLADKAQDSKHEVPEVSHPLPPLSHPSAKECAVCGVTEGLMRCSRCKNKWYCGQSHQRQDWHKHRQECHVMSIASDLNEIRAIAERAQRAAAAQQRQPETNTHQTLKRPRAEGLFVKKEKESSTDSHGNDDIMQTDVIIPLSCPLSIDRIQQAARGKNCNHPRCFDLLTFLEYSQQSHVWQCPVCMKPLPLQEIVIDHAFNEILKECDEEDTQVKKRPDGSYEIVKPQNTDSKPKKKRKKTETASPGVLDSPPLRIESFFASVPPIPAATSAPGASTNTGVSSSTSGSNDGSTMDTAIVLD
ncbi:hypothetical protein AAMO2058_000262500 [Amorphochlora amoebiformis]